MQRCHALAHTLECLTATQSLQLEAASSLCVDSLPHSPAVLCCTPQVDSKSDAGPHLVPLDQMHIGNVVVQWATAVSRKAPLPTLVLGGKEQLQQLQAKVR